MLNISFKNSATLRTLRLSSVMAAALLSGCAHISHQFVASDEAPIVIGPSVRNNRTPFEPALACLADDIVREQKPKMTFTVGEIKDYTGKYNINEGNAITQGGALMVYSALGKLGNAVDVVERYDLRIPELELSLMDKRELGDGRIHSLNPQRTKLVPWIPYFGGSLMRSQYYIVGGITEYNYNIQSGGLQAKVNMAGPQARTYTSSVGVDLRLVDTKTGQVVKTVSLEKQVVGYEVDAGIFQFFGNTLVNINTGATNQEPLQLAVRSVLEEATVRLVGYAEDINTKPCLDLVTRRIAKETASELRKTPNTRNILSVPGAPAGQAVVPLASASAGPHESVIFAFGTASMTTASSDAISRIAQEVSKGPVAVELVAQDSEHWDPTKRNDLVSARIASFEQALATAGVNSSRVMVVWRPDPTDGSIHHDGAGFQKVAELMIK